MRLQRAGQALGQQYGAEEGAADQHRTQQDADGPRQQQSGQHAEQLGQIAQAQGDVVAQAHTQTVPQPGRGQGCQRHHQPAAADEKVAGLHLQARHHGQKGHRQDVAHPGAGVGEKQWRAGAVEQLATRRRRGRGGCRLGWQVQPRQLAPAPPGQRYRQQRRRPPAIGAQQIAVAQADQQAGQDQADANPKVDQPAGRHALLSCQPLEHQAIADAVGQAQRGEGIGGIGLGLQQAAEHVQRQCPGQAAADLRDAVPAHREQRADQVTEVVPAGDAGAFLHGQQAVFHQPGQQRGVYEAAKAVDDQQKNGTGQQDRKQRDALRHGVVLFRMRS